MDHAFRRMIEGGAAHWVLALAVPGPARCPPVLAAFRRLAGRVVPEGSVSETAEGLAIWGRGEAPAAAARLATRLGELLPEAAAPARRLAVPADAASLASLIPAAAGPRPAEPPPEPGGDALAAMRRVLASVPADRWVRRQPIVSLGRGTKARVVAHRLAPDRGLVARALAAGGRDDGARDEEAAVDDVTLRVLDPLLLAFAQRLLTGGGGEGRLVLPLAPAAASGGAFDALEAAAGRSGIARLVPEIELAEAIAAPGPFASARARFLADGQRLMLRCPGREAIGLASALAAPDDLLRLAVEAARGGEGALGALGPRRIVLAACRDEADIAFGLGLGLGLFEGPVVESLLAAKAAA